MYVNYKQYLLSDIFQMKTNNRPTTSVRVYYLRVR